ncbi:MAG: hypothetical protein QXT07_01815 [Archaeoglobaceae archaeon]
MRKIEGEKATQNETLVDRYFAEVEVSEHSSEKLVLSLKKNIEKA